MIKNAMRYITIPIEGYDELGLIFDGLDIEDMVILSVIKYRCSFELNKISDGPFNLYCKIAWDDIHFYCRNVLKNNSRSYTYKRLIKLSDAGLIDIYVDAHGRREIKYLKITQKCEQVWGGPIKDINHPSYHLDQQLKDQ